MISDVQDGEPLYEDEDDCRRRRCVILLPIHTTLAWLQQALPEPNCSLALPVAPRGSCLDSSTANTVSRATSYVCYVESEMSSDGGSEQSIRANFRP